MGQRTARCYQGATDVCRNRRAWSFALEASLFKLKYDKSFVIEGHI